MQRRILLIGIVTIACFVQVRGFDAFGNPQPPDLALVLLLPLASAQRRRFLLAIAFALGLLFDLLLGRPLGVSGLPLLAALFGASYVRGAGGTTLPRRLVASLVGLALFEIVNRTIVTALLGGGDAPLLSWRLVVDAVLLVLIAWIGFRERGQRGALGTRPGG